MIRGASLAEQRPISQLLCGAVRARSLSRCQHSCPCPCRGAMCQRVSTPGAPPLLGVKSTPVGGGCPFCAPVSAARCSRLICVSPGKSGRSATQRARAPERSTSSIAHNRSSARFGEMKSKRDGLIQALTPSLPRRSFAQDGEIHITGPSVCMAIHIASVRREGPHAS